MAWCAAPHPDLKKRGEGTKLGRRDSITQGMPLTVHCLYPAVRLALVLVAVRPPAGLQEVPTGVTYQLLDSALKARIQAPPASADARTRPLRSFVRRLRPTRDALLVTGGALLVLLGWVRRGRSGLRGARAGRGVIVETLSPEAEACGALGPAGPGRRPRSGPTPAKPAKPVPLPPHVVRFLQANARARSMEAAGAGIPPDAGRSVHISADGVGRGSVGAEPYMADEEAPAGDGARESASRKPPGGLDCWVPRYGARGEE